MSYYKHKLIGVGCLDSVKRMNAIDSNAATLRRMRVKGTCAREHSTEERKKERKPFTIKRALVLTQIVRDCVASGVA